MSEEITSQDNTEDVAAEQNQEQDLDINIGKPEEGKEDDSAPEKGPEPLYKDESEEESKEETDEDKEPAEDEEKSESEEGEEKEEAEELKLEAPENSLLTDADMERIANFSKEQGLSKEAAEALVKEQSELAEGVYESFKEQHAESVKSWRDASIQDKEIGGDNIKESVALAKRAAERFGTEQFLKDLEATGFGEHPEVIRVFARIGKAMQSGPMVRSGVQAGQEKSMEEIFYGKQS